MNANLISYLGVIGIMACGALFIFLFPSNGVMNNNAKRRRRERKAERQSLLKERQELVEELTEPR